MSGPLAQAGAAPEPTEYATLPMDRYITGLWTQRSLLRDADVPYLYGKFYSASRYDSLCDGLNRELSSLLSLDRAPGSTQYSGGFPGEAAYSFYSYKWIQDGVEQLNVLQDSPGIIWNITPSVQANLFNKSTGGKARFAGVNTELFFSDGVNQKKWLRAGKAWALHKKFTIGNYIIDSNGNIQSFQGQATNFGITGLEVRTITLAPGVVQNFLVVTLAATPTQLPRNQKVTFSGITAGAYTALNGQSLTYNNIARGWNLSLSTGQIAFETTIATTAFASSAGNVAAMQVFDAQANNLTGITGATQPTWATAWGTTTQDGTVGTGVTWTCYGTPMQNWQVPAPTTSPTNLLQIGAGGPTVAFWQPGAGLGSFPSFGYCIIDANGQYQVADTIGVTGTVEPIWNTQLGGATHDGSVVWLNFGTPTNWIATFQYGTSVTCLIDSNNNLQITQIYYQTQTVWTAGVANTSGSTDTTGASQPAWNTARGGTTTDGAYVWTNAGPAFQLTAGTDQYSFSYHCIDGSVTTAAPVAYALNAMVGLPGMYQVTLDLPGSTNTQVDQIWIWRTPGGQPALIFLDSIPNLLSGASQSYIDVVPDATTNGDQALIPQIPAPIAHQSDPPLANMTAPVYHMGRIWGIVDNTVVNSGGPDTITGNGNTAFPPLNSFPFPEQPIKIRPITIQGGGTIVYTTSNTWIITGQGTASNPFSPPQIYMASVGLLSYDAEDIVGSTSYLFTTKRKFCSLDPSAGYTEVGFPIGDQFKKVTTGGFNAALYDPASTYVTWHEADSGDTGIYVADGAVGWFRYSPISSPENGYVWSPFRAIVGGTSAVQSVETSPGITSLLIGAPASVGGPTLMRDTSTNQDNGTSYPSYFTIGNITLCESGQIAEVAHIALKSPALGARPKVSVLFGELFATTQVPFDELHITGNDPPDLPPSQTMYSDRYAALQNGVAPLCDNFQFKVDYGTQNFPDRLLKHSIYGAHHEERRQQ